MSYSDNPATAMIWAMVPADGDAVTDLVRGMLVAFQARPNGNDLPLLWHSEMKSARDSVGLFAKYSPPTIADGKVFVASFGDPAFGIPNKKEADDLARKGRVHAYGLLR